MAKKDDTLYRLLVELAEFDPEAARPGDWLNYEAGLAMIGVGGNVQLAAGIFQDRPPSGHSPEAFVRAIHPDLRHVVRQFAASGRVEALVLVPITANVAVVQDERKLRITGSSRDTAILRIVLLLASAEAPPIGMCPEDKKLFVRVRRQQYCSRQCVNRVNMRAHRQRLLEQMKATKKRRPK